MTKKLVIIAALAAVLLWFAIPYFWGPSSAPPGQPPLFTLSTDSFSEFEKAFDAQTGEPRLVLLLSPT